MPGPFDGTFGGGAPTLSNQMGRMPGMPNFSGGMQQFIPNGGFQGAAWAQQHPGWEQNHPNWMNNPRFGGGLTMPGGGAPPANLPQGAANLTPPQGGGFMQPGGGAGGPPQPGGGLPQGATNLTPMQGGFAGGLQPYVGPAGNGRMA